MEIKAVLTKPYTDDEKFEFLVQQNQTLGYEIRETETELQAWGYTEAELVTRRKANFDRKFLTLETNKNFRLEPKGYANAQQSIDTVNNMVSKIGSLTEQIATMVLFYETPDFTKPEQCTEEWLVQHQYSAEPMAKAEWDAFYIDFTTKYAQKMYQQALQAQQGN